MVEGQGGRVGHSQQTLWRVVYNTIELEGRHAAINVYVLILPIFLVTCRTVLTLLKRIS